MPPGLPEAVECQTDVTSLAKIRLKPDILNSAFSFHSPYSLRTAYP